MARSRTLVALAFMSGICCQAVPIFGEERSAPAGAAPTIITWEVEASGGVRAQLRARPGEAVHLTRPDGSEIAMVPRLLADEAGTVSFEVFEVSGGPEKQSLRPVDVIEASPGVVALSRTVADLSLKLVGFASANPRSSKGSGWEASATSDRLVRWILTLADGRLVKLAAMDGMVTRVNLADGREFGLKTLVQEDGNVVFRVLVGDRTKASATGGELSEIERFDLKAGGEYSPQSLENSLIKVVDVERVPPEAWRLRGSHPNTSWMKGCCVTCSGVRVCGCSVSMDCGDCCAPPCCRPEF